MKEAYLFQILAAIRRDCQTFLPVKTSVISFDIILCIAKHHYSGQKLTVKELYSLLPHSYSSVRYYYFELIEEGWLQHTYSDNDGRIKYVEPTIKLLEKLEDFAYHLDGILKNESKKS